MKKVKDLKSLFIRYISNILIKIRNVVIKQLFFILEKGLNLYIFNQSFEMIMCMARQILNNESVCVIIFNLENDMVQAIFQLYTPGDPGDHYNY